MSPLSGRETTRVRLGGACAPLTAPRVGMPAYSSGRRAHRAPLLKAFAAVNRATLRRFEGDGGLLPTLRTGRLGFASLESVSLTCTISAPRLAPLAPLGLVLEALVGEKHLFAGGEDELSTTFSALENPILVLHRLLRDPTLVGGQAPSFGQAALRQVSLANPAGQPSRGCFRKPKGPFVETSHA